MTVRARTRGHFTTIDDDAAGVERAGRPQGWLPVAERVVAELDLNVNRRGVVFVVVGEGRDVDALCARVADASAAVHSALLELDEPGRVAPGRGRGRTAAG